MKIASKIVSWLLLLVAALPLLIYPFVLLANIMALAGHRSGDEPIILLLPGFAFVLGTTAYPLVYILCVVAAIAYMKKARGAAAVACSTAPLAYLALMAGLAALWSVMG